MAAKEMINQIMIELQLIKWNTAGKKKKILFLVLIGMAAMITMATHEIGVNCA